MLIALGVGLALVVAAVFSLPILLAQAIAWAVTKARRR